MATKRSLKVVPYTPAPVIVTRDVIVARRFDWIVDEAKRTIENSRQDLATWTVRLQNDPVAAFEWSSDAFKHAARIKVCGTLLHIVDAESKASVDEYSSQPSLEAVLRRLRDYLSREVVRKARWPDHSTSAPSNEMSLCLNAEMAEWLEKTERAIERIDEA